MSEEINKSTCSGYTNREGIFLSQVPMKKRILAENFSSEGKFPLISPSNFISLEGIHDENNKNSKIKGFNNIFSSLNKNSNKRNSKTNSSIHINFSGEMIGLIPLEKNKADCEKKPENQKNKVIMKYINYESPKHFTPHNNFFVKLYEFEKNLSLRKYYKQVIEKWKIENKKEVLKGTLAKRIKPEIIKTSLQKEEMGLKKIDLLKIFPKTEQSQPSSKQRNTSLKERKFLKLDNFRHFYNGERGKHFFPEELNRKRANNDDQKNEKSKLLGPSIFNSFKSIKKREKLDQEILIEGKSFSQNK